jgi:hypothetical protein
MACITRTAGFGVDGIFRSGAPRLMKMGTIASPFRYDEASESATNLAGVAATDRLGAVNDGLQLIDDASHAVQELAAGRGRPRAAVGSLEQPHTQQPSIHRLRS